MDSILTLIAFFVVIFIFDVSKLATSIYFTNHHCLLDHFLFTQRRHVHVHTYNSTQNQNEQPKSPPKHGAIDVEYTEHEDDGDEQ